MHRWTKATQIPPAVKRTVEERDNHCCIFCKSPYAAGEAHYVPRSKGGRGIEQNILTVCRECHRKLDDAGNKWMHDYARDYLMQHYQGWDEDKLIYRKFEVHYAKQDT